ncbi:cupin domain-containing protein [Leptothoe sp. ISB3NOV94-8A]
MTQRRATQGQDWMVADDGQVQACTTPRQWDLLETPYHFHRFLTQVEDVLKKSLNEYDCLPAIRHLVRKLALNSYWLQTQHPKLSTLSDVAIQTLYNEIGYPLTVQTNTYPPGMVSPIHNHGTWGVVTLLKGEEKNTFWQHTPTQTFKDKLTPVGEKIFRPGDVISFSPGAIHCVEAFGSTPLVTFNLYGETHSKDRFKFDPKTHQAKNF